MNSINDAQTLQERATPANAAPNAQVARLLELARQDLAALRLTSPPGRNAVERYRAVLAERPEDERANKGLQSVVGKYVSLASRATEAGKLDNDSGVDTMENWCDHPTGSVPNTSNMLGRLKAKGVRGSIMTLTRASDAYCARMLVSVYGLDPVTGVQHVVEGPYTQVAQLVSSTLGRILGSR
jgi:hypothetical protein